jgi:hypothetical protein
VPASVRAWAKVGVRERTQNTLRDAGDVSDPANDVTFLPHIFTTHEFWTGGLILGGLGSVATYISTRTSDRRKAEQEDKVLDRKRSARTNCGSRTDGLRSQWREKR